MKVVITTDYGFSISREGWLWLLDHGFDPCENFSSGEYTFNNSWFTDENQLKEYRDDIESSRRHSQEHLHPPDNDIDWYEKAFPTFESYVMYGGCSYHVEMPRNHPLLVQMVEELGELANPWMKFCDPPTRTDRGLKIVEIPDGINFDIIDPDGGGTEYIRERLDKPARTWS